jgi:PIN domain nuclease of toxin-antitoxin system
MSSLGYREIADSLNLPGSFHSDPSDRIIVSTARILVTELVTMDQEIKKYSKKGFLKTFDL